MATAKKPRTAAAAIRAHDPSVTAAELKKARRRLRTVEGEKRGRGRPRSNLDERFQVRCSAEDLYRWELRARSLGLTVGQWLRMLALKAEKER